MPFCDKCGADLDASASYCSKCGAAVARGYAPTGPAPITFGPPPTYPNQPAAPSLPPPPRPSAASFVLPPAPQRPSVDYFGNQQSSAELAGQEQFLGQFTWAAGCPLYFCSAALGLFALLWLVTLGFDTLSLALAARNTPALNSVQGDPLLQLLFALNIASVCGLQIWAGKVARRQRWQQLNWSSFQHFRHNEQAWYALGALGWGFGTLLLAFALAIGLAVLSAST